MELGIQRDVLSIVHSTYIQHPPEPAHANVTYPERKAGVID